MYLLDSSAWIEILQGTKLGKKAAELAEQNRFFTASISMAEISKWCHLNGVDALEKLSKIEQASLEILQTTRISELRAGSLWLEVNRSLPKKTQKVGLIDCILAAIAEENDLTILTKDKHFLLFESIQREILKQEK